jgi:hypothetical protein
MFARNPQTVGLDDQDGRTNDTEEISVDSSVIAQVLGRAHRTAEAQNAPNEARVILHVAHSFADELAGTDHRFDRERFIQAATEDQS